ncbi:hypothetical protein Aduo_001110 [Ancylostoma duodenale]
MYPGPFLYHVLCDLSLKYITIVEEIIGRFSLSVVVSVARAIFNNVSEFDEELPFEKGDVLRVLSERPEIEGISDGWWLCVDRNGRKGLAPANRLQVMHRFDKGPGRHVRVFRLKFDSFHPFSTFNSATHWDSGNVSGRSRLAVRDATLS